MKHKQSGAPDSSRVRHEPYSDPTVLYADLILTAWVRGRRSLEVYHPRQIEAMTKKRCAEVSPRQRAARAL